MVIVTPRHLSCAHCTARSLISPLPRTGMFLGLWDLRMTTRIRRTWRRSWANIATTGPAIHHSMSYRSMVGDTTRATPTMSRTSTHSTLWPSRIRPPSSSTALAPDRARPNIICPGSAPSSDYEKSPRRSAGRMLSMRGLFRGNMQCFCATCLLCSACVASACSSRVVILVSAKVTAWLATALSSSSRSSPHPVRTAFYLSPKVVHTCEYTLLTTLPGPYVTAVGGTTSHTPEAAAILSGGGFSNYFQRPGFQQKAVPSFFQHLGSQYQGKYKCVRFRDLICLRLLFHNVILVTAFQAEESPTSPPRLWTSRSSPTVSRNSCLAQAGQRLCVSPSLLDGSSILEHPPDLRCINTDRSGHNLTPQ